MWVISFLIWQYIILYCSTSWNNNNNNFKFRKTNIFLTKINYSFCPLWKVTLGYNGYLYGMHESWWYYYGDYLKQEFLWTRGVGSSKIDKKTKRMEGSLWQRNWNAKKERERERETNKQTKWWWALGKGQDTRLSPRVKFFRLVRYPPDRHRCSFFTFIFYFFIWLTTCLKHIVVYHHNGRKKKRCLIL